MCRAFWLCCLATCKLLCCQRATSSQCCPCRLQIAGEPAYDALRTKQQLGYSVHVGTRLTHGALGFCVTVASGGGS